MLRCFFSVRSPGSVAPSGRASRRLAIALLCAAMVGVSATLPADARELPPVPENWEVEIVTRGLSGPVAVAPAPDGRVYVAERSSGRIRIIEDQQLLPEPLLRLDAVSLGERGLLGLCADPELRSTEVGDQLTLFAYWTPSLDRARIVRIRVEVGEDTPPRVLAIETIVDDLPASGSHNGGALTFGPDRCLYFSVGDLDDPEGTRPAGSRSGRIHRVETDGSIPRDNPWPGRSEFVRGIRNCFGLTAVPGVVPTVLYLTDNGPIENDEVNRATAGDHLGWPDGTGKLHREDRRDPIHTWSPTTAPVGIVCLPGSLLPDGTSSGLLFGEYVSGRLVELHLDAPGTMVLHHQIFLERPGTPIYALAVDEDGALWFTAGNAVGQIRPSRIEWIRGDLNGNGRIEQRDLQLLLVHLTKHVPISCLAAADVDGNGVVDLADAVSLRLFLSGELVELPPPFLACGVPAGSRLDCEHHEFCAD